VFLHYAFFSYNNDMQTLRDVLRDAEKRKVAIGHFNFSDFAQLWGIVRAAVALKAPVVLGVSEGERGFVGARTAVAIVQSLRKEFRHPIFLNADHTYDLDKVREAAEAGFDAVIFDGAKLPLDENIARTKEAVRIAKKANRTILVEGEIGYIGQSSKVFEALPEGAAINSDDLPTPEQAAELVNKTKVDLLAPAVGNVHGMFKGAPNPNLDIERVRAIRKAARVPLVLHGGSGVRDEDFIGAIKAGISLVHVSTELRVVWREGLDRELEKQPDQIAPYKLFREVVSDVSRQVDEHLRLFGGKAPA
jgi:fructose-bisphosphate aldolase, class II